MKRTAAFKVGKIGFKSLFFTVLYAKKFALWTYHSLKSLKRNALEKKGECPNCGSYDLDYGDEKMVSLSSIVIRFECLSCGERGEEMYALDYLKTIEEPDREPDPSHEQSG